MGHTRLACGSRPACCHCGYCSLPWLCICSWLDSGIPTKAAYLVLTSTIAPLLVHPRDHCGFTSIFAVRLMCPGMCLPLRHQAGLRLVVAASCIIKAQFLMVRPAACSCLFSEKHRQSRSRSSSFSHQCVNIAQSRPTAHAHLWVFEWPPG
jgi:TRAP-type uncharacterized transport system fused permease subunit